MNFIDEAAVEYQRTGSLSSPSRTTLMKIVRGGIGYDLFETLFSTYPFSIEDWSNFLHLSERTLQRYKKDDKHFDSLQSEKILQISMIYQRGLEVFGDQENFNTWLDTKNISLSNQKPKDLLDNAFGIALLDEILTRIEHGVLA